MILLYIMWWDDWLYTVQSADCSQADRVRSVQVQRPRKRSYLFALVCAKRSRSSEQNEDLEESKGVIKLVFYLSLQLDRANLENNDTDVQGL